MRRRGAHRKPNGAHQEGLEPFSSFSSVSGFLINSPAFLYSGRDSVGEPFVLSPPTCSQFGQIQTKRGEPYVDVKRGLPPLKKNDSRPLDASATIMCHFLQLILVP